MKKRVKRVAAMMLVLLLCLPMVVIPASARPISDRICGYYETLWTEAVNNIGHLINPFESPLFLAIKEFFGPGVTPETATNEDWIKAENAYVDDVQNKLNSTVVNPNGILYPLTPDRIDCGIEPVNEEFFCSADGGYSHALFASPHLALFRFTPLPSSIFPSVGYISSISEGYGVGASIAFSFSCYIYGHGRIPAYPSHLAVDPFCSFDPLVLTVTPSNVVASSWYAYVRSWLLVEPLNYDLNTFTQNVGGINSRVGNFTGNFGYYGDNGQLVVGQDITIINEKNMTFFNPTTGKTSFLDNYNYDYSDRSYHMTTVDNSKIDLIFGNDEITLKQGDKTTTLYYIKPEITPPPTPSPTPSPSPTLTPAPSPTVSPVPTSNPSPSPSTPVVSPPVTPPPVDPGHEGILGFLKTICDFIAGLGKSIWDGITKVIQFFFLPSEDVMQKFRTEVDTKLPIIGSLQAVGADFVSTLQNPGRSAADLRMTTVVDLGKKSGGIFGAAKVNLLDVTWYLDYKKLVDDIIVGFAWLVFLWNLYGALPSIIHGGASGLHTTAEIQKLSSQRGRGRHDY